MGKKRHSALLGTRDGWGDLCRYSEAALTATTSLSRFELRGRAQLYIPAIFTVKKFRKTTTINLLLEATLMAVRSRRGFQSSVEELLDHLEPSL